PGSYTVSVAVTDQGGATTAAGFTVLVKSRTQGDFNGDGIADVGIYQPNKDFFALNYLNAQAQSIGQNVAPYGFHTGGVFAVPITGDFNGDGVTDIGIYQPNNDFFGLDYINAAAQSIGQN